MTFDSITHVVSWFVGLALLVFFGVMSAYEYKVPPVHTVHLAMYLGGMLVALIIMGFASTIAGGVETIGGKAAPYLPWNKSGGGAV